MDELPKMYEPPKEYKGTIRGVNYTLKYYQGCDLIILLKEDEMIFSNYQKEIAGSCPDSDFSKTTTTTQNNLSISLIFFLTTYNEDLPEEVKSNISLKMLIDKVSKFPLKTIKLENILN